MAKEVKYLRAPKHRRGIIRCIGFLSTAPLIALAWFGGWMLYSLANPSAAGYAYDAALGSFRPTLRLLLGVSAGLAFICAALLCFIEFSLPWMRARLGPRSSLDEETWNRLVEQQAESARE